MEFVDGRPIDAWCRERNLSVQQRLALLLTVAEAIQAAHRRLVVHRDLKPGNILVREDGTVKLLDFGLAKLLDRQPGSSPETRTGHRWMTPEYAAPEQILAQPVTTLTDVYQLGAVMYQILAGRLPFTVGDGGLHSLEEAILHNEPALPSQVVDDEAARRAMKGDLDAIILKALSRKPEDRYVSASELSADLRRYLDGQPVEARHGGWAYRAGTFLRRTLSDPGRP
jgi:serine/threonine-protein kinase